MRFIQKYPYIVVTIAFIIINVISFFVQDRIYLNDGKGWDGLNYFNVTEQIKNDVPISGRKPFVKRILLPYVISILPLKILDGFFLINLIANFISSLLLFKWLSKFTKNNIIPIACCLFFMLHWLSFVRFNHFYPANCDPLTFLSILIILLLLQQLYENPKDKKALIWFCITIFISTFNREFSALFTFPLLFIYKPFSVDKFFFVDLKRIKKALPVFIFPFLSAIPATLIVSSQVAHMTHEYNFIFPIKAILFTKSISELLLSVFNIYGLFFIVFLFFYKTIISELEKHQHLIPFFLLSIVLSWFGAGDTERFVIWFSPILFVFLIAILEQHHQLLKKLPIVLLLSIPMIFTLRIFAPIPQPYNYLEKVFHIPILTTINQRDYINGFAYTANENFVFVALCQYVALSILLFMALRYYQLTSK